MFVFVQMFVSKPKNIIFVVASIYFILVFPEIKLIIPRTLANYFPKPTNYIFPNNFQETAKHKNNCKDDISETAKLLQGGCHAHDFLVLRMHFPFVVLRTLHMQL